MSDYMQTFILADYPLIGLDRCIQKLYDSYQGLEDIQNCQIRVTLEQFRYLEKKEGYKFDAHGLTYNSFELDIISEG